jgi:hypothetical protein
MRKAVINAVLFPALAVVVALAIFYFVRRRRGRGRGRSVLPSHGGARADRFQAAGGASGGYVAGGEEALLRFPGGEALTVAAILEAPGEVVAKSSHSTLYRAGLSAGEAVALLRFVRPACAAAAEDAAAAARVLGAARHPNLVPIRALYIGPRGEKLLVHPFYAAGSLRRFLQGLFSLHVICFRTQLVASSKANHAKCFFFLFLLECR